MNPADMIGRSRLGSQRIGSTGVDSGRAGSKRCHLDVVNAQRLGWAVVAMALLISCSSPNTVTGNSSGTPAPTSVQAPSLSAISSGQLPAHTLGPDDDVPPVGVGLIRPGVLPAGVYRTKYFPAQLSVTLDAGWTSNEDSTGEFSVSKPHGSSTSDLLFWQDVTPVAVDGTLTDPVGPTSADLMNWLKSNHSLVITDEPDTTIAGLTTGMGVRLWAVDRPDGNRIVILAQADDPATLQAFLPDVEKVLSTVTFVSRGR